MILGCGNITGDEQLGDNREQRGPTEWPEGIHPTRATWSWNDECHMRMKIMILTYLIMSLHIFSSSIPYFYQ